MKKILIFSYKHKAKIIILTLLVASLAYSIFSYSKTQTYKEQLLESRMKYISTLSAEEIVYFYIDTMRSGDKEGGSVFQLWDVHRFPDDWNISYRTIDEMRVQNLHLERDKNDEKYYYDALSKSDNDNWEVACFRIPLDHYYEDGSCNEKPSYAYTFSLRRESESSPWQVYDFGFI